MAPGSRTGAFADYLRVIDGAVHPADADVARRPEWSRQELAADVVLHAMRGVAMLLSDFPPAVHDIGDMVWSTTKAIVYRDCRIQLLGTTATVAVPQRLLSEVADRSREAIAVCILPGVGLEFVTQRSPVSLDIRTGAIPLYPSDVDALASERVRLEELIEYKLFRRILFERPDSETQYLERFFDEYGCGRIPHPNILGNVDVAIEARGEHETDWLQHPYLLQLDTQLSRGRHSLLFGYSSSGKSVLAFQAARRRTIAGWHVRYVNLSDDVPSAAGLVQDLLFSSADRGYDPSFERPRLPRRLIIVDDLQSRPAVARLFLMLASVTHRVRDNSRPVLLGVSWKEFAAEAAELCPDVAPFAVHAHLVRDRILAKYSIAIEHPVLAAVSAEISDDLYLLRLALEVTARQKTQASREEVAEDVWQEKIPANDRPILPEAARRAALLTAAIGQFDIHVPPEFVQRTAQVEPRIFSKLIESRLLRRIGDRITLGHRSLCALMAWWLGKNGAWRELEAVGGPADVPAAVLSYLAATGTTATMDTLRALVARAGFKRRDALSQRAAAIMDLWRAFDAVVERVERQQTSDPTWGNTPSSSMFVAVLLSQIGKGELAQPSVDFLRGHWSIVNEQLEIDTSGLSTVVDFALLHERMREEDAKNERAQGAETALEINIERFHKAWLAGLILGAEAAADRPRIPHEQLAVAVEQEQIRRTGAFYPHRVPWCTARVVLGLAACGRNITTSPVVERAVEWLLRDRRDEGASSGGIWHSGTGTWNSSVETTALVLLSVVRAGLDPLDSRLSEGRTFLLSQREQWAGFEGAAAIEALLATGSRWEEVAADTARLSHRTLDQSLWLRATLPANEILQQTCYVAQAATHLIQIGWTAIQADLTELLEALDLPAEAPAAPVELLSAPVPSPLANGEHIAEVQAVGDDAAEKIARIHDLVLSNFSVVGDYLRFDERARNDLRNRYQAIRAAIEHKSIGRENYLIWAPPGSGKTYFVTEIAKALQDILGSDGFQMINLSLSSRDGFGTALRELRAIHHKPILCMVDEIDGRSSEAWPYEELYSCLDWNLGVDRHVVFVAAGSGGRGLNGMMRTIADQSRGPDLIDRIPEANRFEIPTPAEADRLLVFAKQVLIAAALRHQDVTEIERVVLYYVLNSEALATPRQLAEFAKAGVGRMEVAERRLLYDHLFRVGDRQRMDFWVKHQESVSQLQGTFVRLGN